MMQEGGKHLTPAEDVVVFSVSQSIRVFEYKCSDHSQTRTKSILP